jgi:hypothetical protein
VLLTVHPLSASVFQPGTFFTASFIKLFLQTYTEEFSGTPLRNFCIVWTCNSNGSSAAATTAAAGLVSFEQPSQWAQAFQLLLYMSNLRV